MRKLMALAVGVALVLGVFVACENATAPYVSPLSPPSWIIGSWSDDFDIFNWTFTSDNALYSILGTLAYDCKELATDPDITVADAAPADSYTITLSMTGVEDVHTFERQSATTLTWTAVVNGFMYVDAELLTKQ